VRKGERGKARGGAVVGRPETRVDGYSSPSAKKLVLQVSKAGLSSGRQGVRWGGSVVYCVNIAMNEVCPDDFRKIAI
jgi:hypothetical protein